MPEVLRFVRILAGLAVLATTCTADIDAQDMRRPKKLIATGWDQADTQRLRENLEQMERRPFDGVIFEVVGRDERGGRIPLRPAFQNVDWKKEWFQSAIDDLAACRFKRFTDNFVQFGANPGDVDWFDDAGWRAIADHWRIAAWVAKQSACKGILFDPEPYTKPHAQFRYGAQPQHDRHSFEEYYAKARRRGRSVMEAVVAEYPNITLFCYFMNSVAASAAGRPDPRRALAASGYGLYPALIDGWLDAAPPSVTFVDGCESAYRYNSEREYLEAAVRIKGACQELVSPENRAKYRAQVQVSFGVYLDAYWNPKESEWGRWYIDGLGGSRVERLRANVQTAMRVADEYVWIYGEKFRWWPTPSGGVKQQTWPEALPGCEEILRYVRDPVDYARVKISEMKEAGKLVNLARNGDFSAAAAADAEGRQYAYREGGPPAGWSAWQETGGHGAFTWDRETGASGKGAARASGVSNGCFLQDTPVAPGQRYAVRASLLLRGAGDAWLRVRWRTADGQWTRESQDKIFYGAPTGDVWREVFGVVEAPEGAGRLVILLGVAGQKAGDDVVAGDIVWFDDVALYRLP